MNPETLRLLTAARRLGLLPPTASARPATLFGLARGEANRRGATDPDRRRQVKWFRWEAVFFTAAYAHAN